MVSVATAFVPALAMLAGVAFARERFRKRFNSTFELSMIETVKLVFVTPGKKVSVFVVPP